MNPEPSFVPADLDPLLVTSPTIRSGTTLLQRLLCSSPRALIYGEMCGQDLRMTLNLYSSRTLILTGNKEYYQRTMRQVLEGQVNDWILDLTPDVEEYLAAVGRSSFSWLGFCRDYAHKMGRPAWGIKLPGMTPALMQLIRQLLPASRLLYIHRDVVDCLKSAKAAAAVRSLEEVKAFCQSWVESLRYIRGLGADARLLVVSFADLLAEPGKTLERIAAFSGAVDMNQTVLEHKINAYKGYTPPADLTDAEREISAAGTAVLRVE